MIRCPRRGDHRLPTDDESDHSPTTAGMGDSLSAHDVPRLVAAYLDDCAPCVIQVRSTTYSSETSVAVLVTAWLSEAAARLEAAGSPLPETAAGIVAGQSLSLPTRLLAGLVPLAGPERPGGSVRVTRQEVARALQNFGRKHGNNDWPTIFDDALQQLATLLGNNHR